MASELELALLASCDAVTENCDRRVLGLDLLHELGLEDGGVGLGGDTRSRARSSEVSRRSSWSKRSLLVSL